VATPSMTSIEPRLLEAVEVEVDGEMVTQTPLEVTVLANAEVGQISGQISIRTGDPTRMLQVTVTGEVIGDLEAKPARVQLSGLAPSAPINAQVRIGSRSGKPFKITKAVDAPVGTGVLMVAVSEDNSVQPPAYVLTLTGTSPATVGAFRGDIVLTTDIESEKTFKIPYFGFTRNAQPRPTSPTGGPPSVWDTQPSLLVPPR